MQTIIFIVCLFLFAAACTRGVRMWAASLLFSLTVYFFFFLLLLLLLLLLLIFHTLFHLLALYFNLESQTSFVRQCQWDQSERILCQDEAFLFFFSPFFWCALQSPPGCTNQRTHPLVGCLKRAIVSSKEDSNQDTSTNCEGKKRKKKHTHTHISTRAPTHTPERTHTHAAPPQSNVKRLAT